MTDMTGKVALVTGAGRGLGLAYAKALAESGVTVYLQDTGTSSSGEGKDESVAQRAADSLVSAGATVYARNDTLTSIAGCQQLLADIQSQQGRLDILIHNAGWVGYEPVGQLREETFDRMMAITVKAGLWLSQAAWPLLCAAGGGRIILTTSDRAIYPQYAQVGLCSYAAAKMAAIGIVNVLGLEGQPHGIVANAISPVAKTRMWGITDEPHDLHPQDVVPGVLFLASEQCRESGWILRASNGQFHATRASEAHGVNYPFDLNAPHATTSEEVAAAWHIIAPKVAEKR